MTISASLLSGFPQRRNSFVGKKTKKHGFYEHNKSTQSFSIQYILYNALILEKAQLVLTSKQTIVALFALPAPFKDGNVVCFPTPRLEVDAGLESVLLEGLQNHTFCIDLCREDDKTKMKP